MLGDHENAADRGLGVAHDNMLHQSHHLRCSYGGAQATNLRLMNTLVRGLPTSSYRLFTPVTGAMAAAGHGEQP